MSILYAYNVMYQSHRAGLNFKFLSFCCFIHIGIKCKSLPNPKNGFIVFSDPANPHDFESTANYSCDPGYQLIGGDPVRHCVETGQEHCDISGQKKGEWNGTAPECKGKVMSLFSNIFCLLV